MLFPHCSRYLSGLELVLFFASLAQAAQPLVLEAELDHSALGLYSDILEDHSGKWTLHDVLTPEVSAQFSLGTSENRNLVLTKSA